MALPSFDEVFASRYALLRRKLIVFFTGRRAYPAEDLADEVFVRLLKKREEGTAIEDLDRFAYGIAKFVLLESLRGPKTIGLEIDGSLENSSPGSLTPGQLISMPDSISEDLTLERKCLNTCIEKLPKTKQQMLVSYYSIEPGSANHIELRKKLAEQFQMKLETLHVSVYRIRTKVGECAKECADRK